ncbi:hypothetical protein J6590_003066, partial [Homalodisca vitripennis]
RIFRALSPSSCAGYTYRTNRRAFPVAVRESHRKHYRSSISAKGHAVLCCVVTLVMRYTDHSEHKHRGQVPTPVWPWSAVINTDTCSVTHASVTATRLSQFRRNLFVILLIVVQ